ncbi:MAG: c-type cytochrome [Rhodobacteraceae bacterium]|nr:c-type cytochrome [Paracoccaceae bacterium]
MGPDGPILSQDLAGSLIVDDDMLTAYSANITPAGAVSGWTDAELGRAIREGIRPDGSLIGPPMPFPMYRGLADDDLAAIVAYLRTVPAVDSQPPKSEYRFPLPPAYGPPVDTVTAPPRGVTVDYGEYMAKAVSHCMECHTPFGPQGPMIGTDLGRGGFRFEGPWGVSVAPNLTTHEDGLASYSDAELEQMIVEGVRPDGSPMLPPMPYGYFAKMTEDDLAALILYLRTLPPLPDAG